MDFSSQAKQRLIRDFKLISKDPPVGVNASPKSDDIFKWIAIIWGPKDSPWDNSAFKLELNFPQDYPLNPPSVSFVTPVFHPNVYTDGSICLDILQNQWAPVYDVAAILTSIQSLLDDPNPASPANSEASRLYLDDRRAYIKKVQQVASECWSHPSLKELAGPGNEEDEYSYEEE